MQEIYSWYTCYSYREEERRTKIDVIKEINTVLPILKRRFGISRIGVFGSYSTGTASPESDIDILVTFQEGKETFDNYSALLKALDYST